MALINCTPAIIHYILHVIQRIKSRTASDYSHLHIIICIVHTSGKTARFSPFRPVLMHSTHIYFQMGALLVHSIYARMAGTTSVRRYAIYSGISSPCRTCTCTFISISTILYSILLDCIRKRKEYRTVLLANVHWITSNYVRKFLFVWVIY